LGEKTGGIENPEREMLKEQPKALNHEKCTIYKERKGKVLSLTMASFISLGHEKLKR